MITIKRLTNGKMECCIDLTGTKAEPFAPFESKQEDRPSKYVLGYGESPKSALDDAYRALGQHMTGPL